MNNDDGSIRVNELVATPRGGFTLGPLSFSTEPGAFAIVGTAEDGVSLLLAALAGDIGIRSGSILADGHLPSRIRTKIARISRKSVPQDNIRVRELFAIAERSRGESAQPIQTRLEPLGIAALAERSMTSLSREERRAVFLAEGLTSKTVRYVLVDEPYAEMDPRAAAALRELFRQRASEGVSIVIGTSSLRDAQDLAHGHVTIFRGQVVPKPHVAYALAARDRVAVRIVSPSPRPILAALSKEERVRSVHAEGDTIVVRGPDWMALCKAVTAAISRAGVPVTEVTSDTPDLADVRAIIAAIAARPSLAPSVRPLHSAAPVASREP